MDFKNEQDSADKKGYNTEYLPTKCRVTKPPPPKPAANPLQFVKVAPCPLFKKAKEQIKNVEEVKSARKEVLEETEDWQQNLDNWKSSRRKRQEHIIERVVEVKKLEQEENRTRRKPKTFTEMMEDRSKGRHKFNIPVYNDEDTNDLSDYGIGSSSSKANSIRDVDTDDNCSQLDEKEFSASNQSESEHESSTSGIVTRKKSLGESTSRNKSFSTNLYNNNNNNSLAVSPKKSSPEEVWKSPEEEKEQYTYEGAIQDYRTRIRSKINIDESVFKKASDFTKSRENVESIVPKGNISKRKEIFEVEKPIDCISDTTSRLSEAFTNTQSIKDRLKSLEQCTAQPLKSVEKIQLTTKKDLQHFPNLTNDNETSKISYLNNNRSGEDDNQKNFEISSSPEAEMYMNKLNIFNRDLDLLYGKPVYNIQQNLDDYISNYPPSTSSTELMAFSSDREDSGIHTADVSCAVSQSDEPFEELDPSVTMTKFIEKLGIVEEKNKPVVINSALKDSITYNIEYLKQTTASFLSSERKASMGPPLEILFEPNEINHTISADVTDALFIFNSATNLTPPNVKPPPPPEECDGNGNNMPEDNFLGKRMNSTKRIKKEIHIKRSSFLGLDEPTDDQIDPNVLIDKPPDIDRFLQRESQMEKSMYKRLQRSREGSIDQASSSPDSGFGVERQHLTGDKWDSMVKSSTPLHNRQDSQLTGSFTSEEDEIRKREQEIIELIEKEEKYKDTDYSSQSMSSVVNKPTLGSRKFQSPYYQQETNVLNPENLPAMMHVGKDPQREELQRKRDDIHFQNKAQQTRHSLENICDIDAYDSNFSNKITHRKSMPELEHILLEYCKPLPSTLSYKSDPDIKYECEKSTPNIQCAYNRSVLEYCNSNTSPNFRPQEFSTRQQTALPEKNPRLNEIDRMQHGNRRVWPIKPTSHLNAAPKTRHYDNWVRPKNDRKNYNHHWVFQEAELLRISQQNASSQKQRLQNVRDQHHHPPVTQPIQPIQPQRVHSRSVMNNFPASSNSVRTELNPSKEYSQHPYLGHQADHSQLITCPLPFHAGDQDKMLSVSGKKKCSNCGNELGRGAAMIIESLCLFYHMECFKCCVCHMRLGDGRMGTDVRVRNQKLHCHNCYSSEDGVKFSCV